MSRRGMKTAIGGVFLACVLGLTPSTLAQARPPQTRDTVVQPVGTGVIAGKVVTDESNSKPLRRATVTLASGQLQLPQTTVTDDAGGFVFAGLAPGNFTVYASKAAYVGAFYGAKQPGKGPGVPIALLDGQRVTNIVMKLLHGGVVTGVVRTQSGQPVVGLDVQVLPQVLGAGRQTAMMPSGVAAQLAAAGGGGGTATTDDRGVYRVFGLPPGAYLVESRSESLAAVDAHRVTAPEVQWALQSAAQSSSAAPGSAAPVLDPAPAAGQTVNYAPVYYPGTTDPSGATAITLGPNEERTGVDFRTELVPTARVTGLLVTADGQPTPGGQVTIRTSQSDAFDIVSLLIGGGGSTTARDGTFTLSDVAPGHYTITARATPRAPGAGAREVNPAAPQVPLALMGILGGMGGPSAPTLWAMEDVDVNGRDVANVTLTLQPGMTVSGKVVYEGGAPPVDLTRTRISLSTMPTGGSAVQLAASMLLGASSAAVNADGTFQVKGVMPDKYRVSVMGQGMFLGPTVAPAGGFALKSAMWNGRDVSDLPFDVKPNSDVTGLVVTFTDRPTEISGTLLDGAGRAAPGFPIVVFSTDRAYWTIGSRRVQQVRPSSDGKFKLGGLPAGEYYVSAVTDLDPADLYDPAFLERLAATSFKLSLAEGEKKVQDLKLAGGG